MFMTHLNQLLLTCCDELITSILLSLLFSSYIRFVRLFAGLQSSVLTAVSLDTF